MQSPVERSACSPFAWAIPLSNVQHVVYSSSNTVVPRAWLRGLQAAPLPPAQGPPDWRAQQPPQSLQQTPAGGPCSCRLHRVCVRYSCSASGPARASLRSITRQPPKGGFLVHFPRTAPVEPGLEARPKSEKRPVHVLGCQLKLAEFMAKSVFSRISTLEPIPNGDRLLSLS